MSATLTLTNISSLFLAEASWRMKEPRHQGDRQEGKRRRGFGVWLQRLVAVVSLTHLFLARPIFCKDRKNPKQPKSSFPCIIFNLIMSQFPNYCYLTFVSTPKSRAQPAPFFSLKFQPLDEFMFTHSYLCLLVTIKDRNE